MEIPVDNSGNPVNPPDKPNSLEHGDSMDLPPVQSRKRGKCMSRRTGQNPEVRVGKRANGRNTSFFSTGWIFQDRKKKTPNGSNRFSEADDAKRGRTEEAGIHIESPTEFE
jgi:hypothetical protein